MGDYPAPDLLDAFIRAKSPLTQSGAAGQIGIVPAALHGYLKRKQRPRSDIRQRIAKWSEDAVPESAWLTDEERIAVDDVDIAVTPAAAPEKTPEPQADGEIHKLTGSGV